MPDVNPTVLAAIPRAGKVFGVDVTFHPLTIGDIMEWDAFAQGQYRRGARFGMTDGTPQEQLNYRIEANDEAKLICFGSAHAERIEWSHTGCLYLALLSLRHGKPKLTIDEVARMFGLGTKSLSDQRLASAAAKREIHIATGLVSGEVEMDLAKKNESQTASPEKTSPTPDIGDKSTPTSGLSMNATPNG